jgi:hypothetical protein
MKKIADVKYDEVEFVFITNHYDIHLNGVCNYNGELCEFKNKYPDYNEEKDDWEEMIVEIYQLTPYEKFKWYKKKFLFEKLVGYHWTYKNKKRINGFYYRNPRWLYKILFKLYYKIK